MVIKRRNDNMNWCFYIVKSGRKYENEGEYTGRLSGAKKDMQVERDGGRRSTTYP